ncbi:MAG: complex I NDUFA9 subunit family protein [Rhodospirillales bacterium]
MARRVVTVFGGSGFLGRHLIKRLVARNMTVRVAVRHMDHAIFLKPMGDVGQIVPLSVDINDAEAVDVAVHGADAVVNLVGILYERGRRTFQRVHVDGAKTIAEAAAKAGVKQLIHVSAIGADENSLAKYARSKARGEAAVTEAFPGATIVRPSVVFGPEDGFFNLFASVSRLSPVMPVIGCPFPPKKVSGSMFKFDFFGDGGTKMQPVYVGDVADAITEIMLNRDRQGKIYELGGPRTYSFKEIMELVLRTIERRRLLLPLPYWAAKIEAFFLQLLPKPLLTCDQVDLLKYDNVADNGLPGLEDIGITPQAAEAILPTYLYRYRRQARRLKHA